MNQPHRLWVPVCLGVVALLLPGTRPVGAVVDGLAVGGGVSIRQEIQEDKGDFRFSAELFAAGSGREEPYWGYFAVSKELLMAPNTGRVVFNLGLVTPDGKPVNEARWSEDQSVGYHEWRPMEHVNGRWVLSYPLTGARAGTRTLYFAGRIKNGKGTYTKLLFLTIGGRKDLRQADALQFMVYRMAAARGGLDAETLVNAQEAMGAGGKPLIGPEIKD
jgi:hypothetical protein